MSTALPHRPKAPLEADLRILAHAFECCPEGIALVQRARILRANAAFARLFGYIASSELEGRPLADLLPRSHRCAQGPKPRGRHWNTCGYPGCQFDGRRKDGSQSRMESACAEFQAGGETLLVLTARDISKQERRRIARDSDQRYRTMFEAAAIGIVQCTMDGRVVESNPAFERMIGYTRQELRGMHFSDFTHPDDLRTDSALFEEMVNGKRDYYQIELRSLRKDKSHGWVRLTVSLVRGPEGGPEFAIGMAEDINERKLAEAQLREAQKMEAVGRLVGGVAHDFNNLLTAITLYADLLANGLEPNHHLQRHVDEIRLASEQGAALILHLLAMVRQQPVEPQILDINDVITEMRDMLSRLIGENIALQTVLAEDLASVRIDPTEMQQVILNLVLNARDAMPEGGHIKIETLNCARRCRLQRDGDNAPCNSCVAMAVTDGGCGMDAETKAHLFEPFFTTKEPGRGAGLGLATVEAIVRQAGGTIEVQSELRQGTSVTVLLPCAGEPVRQPSPLISEAAPAGTETILLVEDDSQVRGSLSRVLCQYGYRVLVAANGAEALSLSRQFEGDIQLVFTDLVMPGMSGHEVVRQLRQMRPDLRVIATSGFEHAKSRQEPGKEFVFMRKPFTGRTLARTVREVLEADRSSGSEK